jgi:hypothetical protein
MQVEIQFSLVVRGVIFEMIGSESGSRIRNFIVAIGSAT